MALTFNAAINGDTLVGGGSWVNSDGLYLYYGVQEAALTGGGQFRNYLGDQAIDEYLIDLSALITTGPTALSLNPAGCEFPNNFIIDRAEVFVEVVAASSGTGTLDVGLWDLTAGATISDTAIISAMTTAIMTAGAQIDVILNPAGDTAWGSTYAGANMGLVGYAATEPLSATNAPHQVILTAKAGTAVFQSGIVRVKIFSHRSLALDTTYSPGGQD